MEEFAAQQAMIRITTEKGVFKEMWQGTNLKRSLIVIGANFCIQITGQGKFSGRFFPHFDANTMCAAFASKYGTLFLKQVGAVNPFVLQLINSVLFIFAGLCAMYLIDKVGRRSVSIRHSTLDTNH
jgi:MFS transporter, SP family, sugar:H+ symporter